jgi:predicted nucleotidyltransferase
MQMTRDDLGKITSVLSAELSRLLGNRLVGVYLYGSQAREDAKPDSDIDVLVVIKENFDYFGLIEETGQMVADLSLENETVIALAFVSEEDYKNRHTPFLMNVRREAISL